VAPDAAGALLPEPSFDEDDFDGDDESDLDGDDESEVDDESFEPLPDRLSVR
jgi:hypothetical protein